MTGKVEICYWWDSDNKQQPYVAYLHWGRSGTDHWLHGHGTNWVDAKAAVIEQFRTIPPDEELEIS